MPEMKTLNGYEVVDAKAREDIKELQNAGHATEEYVDEAIAAIPKPDYTGLATEAYVDNAIDNIPEVDLSKHALKSELPTKVSQLQNDSKFITREEVPETDLSEYAKKSEIPTVSDFVRNIPSEYITESELEAKGYLTKHQSLAGLATEKYVDDAIDAIPEVDLTPYAKKTDIPDTSGLAKKSDIPDTSIYAKKAELPDFTLYAKKSEVITEIPSEYVTEGELTNKGYATEYFVANKIAEAKLEGEEVDLSGYATKDDIKDFITEIPSEYVTESELNSKGYLTQHQSLSEYAKKSEIPDVSKFITGIPEEYVTETELDAKGYLTKHQSLAGLATEKYVDDAIDAIPAVDLSNKADREHTHPEYLTQHQDLSAYAKKSDIPDVSDFISEIPDEYVTESELEAKGYLTEHQSLDAYAKKTDIPIVPTKTSQLTNDSKFITSIPSEYVTESELNAKGYLTQHQSLTNYATKTYVNNAIEEATFEAASDIVDTLYQHNIRILPGGLMANGIYITVISTYSEKYTFETLWDYVYTNCNGQLPINVLGQTSDGSSSSTLNVVYNYMSTTGYKNSADRGFELHGILINKGSSTSVYAHKALDSTYQYKDYVTTIGDVAANAGGGDIDLSNYATKNYVDNAIEEIEIPDVSNFITMADVEAKNYLTEHQSLDGKADKNHTHSEYLTEHQSLEGYATEDYVDNAIANIDIPEGDGGSGTKFITIHARATTLSADHKAEIIKIFNELTSGYSSNKSWPEGYEFYYNPEHYHLPRLLPLTAMDFRDDQYAKSLRLTFGCSLGECYREYRFDTQPATDITNVSQGEIFYADSDSDEGAWISTFGEDGNLYNANEVYIRAYQSDNSYIKSSSYVVFAAGDYLGNHIDEMFLFENADSNNTDCYWSYNGSSINVYGSVWTDTILYKINP